MRLTGTGTTWQSQFSSVVSFSHDIVDAMGATIKSFSRDYFTKRDRGAVAVLLYDPKADMVAMIQEPRVIGLLFGAGGLMHEFPTGGIKPHQTATEAARHEAEKESGFKPKRMITVQLGSLASAGRIDERMNLFVAEIDSRNIADHINAVRGEKGEDEYIRTRLVTPQRLFRLANEPQAQLNLGTWALATWFRGHYKAIKREWSAKYSASTSFTHIPRPSLYASATLS